MKRLGLFLSLLWLLAVPTKATILEGSTSAFYTGTPTPLFNGGGSKVGFSFAHNSFGDALVVGCSVDDYLLQKISAVTVGGQALALMGSSQLPFSSGYPITQLFFARGLPLGPITISVTIAGSATNGHGAACFAKDFLGVNQLTPTWGVTVTNCKNGVDCPSGLPNNGHQQTVSCSYTPDDDGEVVVMYMYSTLYGPSDNRSELIHASPVSPNAWSFANPEETGPFASPQAALVASQPLTAGVTFTETWQLGIPVQSNHSVETTVIALVLYPQ